MKWVLKKLFSLGLSTICLIFSGKIISLMWGWFLMPVFPSAPALDMIHAAGLNLLFSFPITMSKTLGNLENEIEKSKPNNDGSENWMKQNNFIVVSLCFIFIVYPLYLLGAWALHHVTG